VTTLETERLRLRRFTRADLDAVHAWRIQEPFYQYLSGRPSDREETEAAFERWERHWAELGFGLLAVVDKETGTLIGWSGPQYHRLWPHDPEVGWSLDPAWWGRGLATEAGRASIEWAFGELDFPRVVSITIEANVASRAVMERLGFRLLATVPYDDPLFADELWVHALDRP
jgi:RimJ/RimL family protein N-acetyltransferase